eukprot:gene18486-28528_t
MHHFVVPYNAAGNQQPDAAGPLETFSSFRTVVVKPEEAKRVKKRALGMRVFVVAIGLVIMVASLSQVAVSGFMAITSVDHVASSLLDSVSLRVEQAVFTFLNTPFLVLENTVRFHDMGLFSLQSAEGRMWENTFWMAKAMAITPTFAGNMFMGNEHGHFAMVVTSNNDPPPVVVSMQPPYEQHAAGCPSWQIPCRYLASCDASSGCCVALPAPGADGRLPYWAAGNGTFINDATLSAYLNNTRSPSHATWATAQNPKASEPTICRPDAVGPKPACAAGACPEFNRSYYTTPTASQAVLTFRNSRADYDARGRPWYAEAARLPAGARYFSDFYVCASSKKPCITASVSVSADLPNVGARVTVSAASSAYSGRTGTVVNHTRTMEAMHAVVVRLDELASTTPSSLSRSFNALSPSRALAAERGVSRLGVGGGVGGGVEGERRRGKGLGGDVGEVVLDARDVAAVGAANATEPRLVGVIAASYESRYLSDLVNAIEVGKSGALFIIERRPSAPLVTSGFKCDALALGLSCNVKSVAELGTLPVRVSAFDAYIGDVPSGIARSLYDPTSSVPDGSASGQTEYSATEPMPSAARDVVVSVGGSRYWVRILPIRQADILNIDWLAFVVVPQSDYLDEVYAHVLKMSIVVTCCFVALIAALIAGNYFTFIRPIRKILRELELACAMRVDEMTPGRGSRIREICDILESVDTLGDNLRQYRPFLPAMCLPRTSVDDAGDEVVAVKPPGDTGSLAPLPQCAVVPKAWNGVRLRIGVHEGVVSREMNPVTGRADYLGPVVNMAARLESSGVAGTVCVLDDFLQHTPLESLPPHVATPVVIKRKCVPMKGIGHSSVSVLVPGNLCLRVPEVSMKCDGNDFEASRKRRSTYSTAQTSSGSTLTRHIVLSHERELISSCTVLTIEANSKFVAESGDPVTFGNALLCRLLQCADRCSGTMISAAGAAIHVGFNIGKKCASHGSNSARFIGLIASTDEFGCEGAPNVHIGSSSGRLTSAKIGTRDQRFYCVFGSVLKLSHFLALSAMQIKAFFLVARLPEQVDPAKDPSIGFEVRPVDEWYLKTRGSSDEVHFVVFEVNVTADADTTYFTRVDALEEDNDEGIWNWGPAYLAAFEQGNWDDLTSRGDAVAVAVAHEHSNGRQLVGAALAADHYLQ